MLRRLVMDSFEHWGREGIKKGRKHPFVDRDGPSYLGDRAIQALHRPPYRGHSKTRTFLVMAAALGAVPPIPRKPRER